MLSLTLKHESQGVWRERLRNRRADRDALVSKTIWLLAYTYREDGRVQRSQEPHRDRCFKRIRAFGHLWEQAQEGRETGRGRWFVVGKIDTVREMGVHERMKRFSIQGLKSELFMEQLVSSILAPGAHHEKLWRVFHIHAERLPIASGSSRT